MAVSPTITRSWGRRTALGTVDPPMTKPFAEPRSLISAVSPMVMRACRLDTSESVRWISHEGSRPRKLVPSRSGKLRPASGPVSTVRVAAATLPFPPGFCHCSVTAPIDSIEPDRMPLTASGSIGESNVSWPDSAPGCTRRLNCAPRVDGVTGRSALGRIAAVQRGGQLADRHRGIHGGLHVDDIPTRSDQGESQSHACGSRRRSDRSDSFARARRHQLRPEPSPSRAASTSPQNRSASASSTSAGPKIRASAWRASNTEPPPIFASTVAAVSVRVRPDGTG